MIPRAVLSRRNLIAAGIGAGAASLGGRASLPPAGGDRAAALPGHGPLAAFCKDLRCPETIRGGCLRALPASEASPERLASLILADLPSRHRASTSASALPRLIREGSRHDFANGRISYVDGWLLSLTETRVYALAALLAAWS